MIKNNFDEGFNLEWVETAFFDGELEIPKIEPPKKIIIPPAMIPFSKRNCSKSFSECLIFYEHDIKFEEIIRQPKKFLNDILHFPAIVTPDNSVYRDAPLTVQIANVYRNRAVGHFFQKSGAYVITNVRWGDERSYTKKSFAGKICILGRAVGTYGCIQGKENNYYFRAGLEAMLEELTPKVVLVYGSMPKNIFGGVLHKTEFVNYPDRISKMRKKV